jgi:hypothetical protein
MVVLTQLSDNKPATTSGSSTRTSNSSSASSSSSSPCKFVTDERRGELDVNVAISGDHRRDVWVDVFAPDQDEPLPVLAQYDKKFTDSGDDYIHQAYSSRYVTEAGQYRIEVKYRANTYTWKAQVDSNEAAYFYVDCG